MCKLTLWQLQFPSSVLRNYDHHGRPSFVDVYRTLVEIPEPNLLEVPLEYLQNLAHPQQAGRLGASLRMAEDLYKELQNYYYQ